ncbi:papain-like cysteine protease family protein [Spongiactinospora sp. 9N601]|uniref:papain-like cysteine protease family protein n=1 Tax=Spongiactinospora sp. 9N601 TaxID=3375149 RepID=UPI00379C7167
MFRVAVAAVLAIAAWFAVPAPGYAYTWYRLNFFQQQQQGKYWCWAASGNSIAAYYGYDYSQLQFCNMARAHADINDYCTDEVATLAEDQRAFRRIGISPGNLVERPLDYDEIIQDIDAEHPIITRIGWKSGGGHMEVIFGYDTRGEQVWWSDPLKPPGNVNLTPYRAYLDNPEWEWTHSLYRIGA